MKRVKHFLLASCLFPTLLGAQEMASAYFLELFINAGLIRIWGRCACTKTENYGNRELNRVV